jgi:hypothetical protein
MKAWRLAAVTVFFAIGMMPLGASAGLFDWFSSDSKDSKAKAKKSAGKVSTYKPTAKPTAKPTTRQAAKPGGLGGISKTLRQPFTTHKIANGARSLVSGKKPATASKARATGNKTKQATKAGYNRKANEKPGFFKSLFTPEEPPPPQTVGEWMKLPRLDP